MSKQNDEDDEMMGVIEEERKGKFIPNVLGRAVPDGPGGVPRSVLVAVADLVAWINNKHPGVLQEAFKANKHGREALNTLEDYLQIWRRT
jgi:hypothetical protein